MYVHILTTTGPRDHVTPILLPEKTNKTTNKESTTNENSFISDHNFYTFSNQPTTESTLGATEQPAKIY